MKYSYQSGYKFDQISGRETGGDQYLSRGGALF